MKGNTAEYIIPLQEMFKQPFTKRTNKAIRFIKKFALRHGKAKEALLSNEVNEFIWANSKNLPRRIEVILRKADDAVKVYLKGGKQLEADKKKEADEKKAKEKKKKEEKKKKSEKKEGSTAEKEKEEEKPKVDEEQLKKLKEKKTIEKTAEKAAIKRKTDRM